MHTIANENIIIVEDINKVRKPLTGMDAIYVLQPNADSVSALIGDFDGTNNKYKENGNCENLYKAAHVFFLQACSDELFLKLGKSKASRYINTLKEINIAFLPIEKQVFSLDSQKTFSIVYNKSNDRYQHLESIADQLATLCSTLGEYPSVRYRSEFGDNFELAKLVQKKLDQYKQDDPAMNDDGEKSKSQLLILDRGFDPVSPLLHELTYQAMVYDLLNIEKDVYKFHNDKDGDKEVILEEE